MIIAGLWSSGCDWARTKDDDDDGARRSPAASRQRQDLPDGLRGARGDGTPIRGAGLPEGSSYLVDLGLRSGKDGFSFPNGERVGGQPAKYPETSKGFLDVDGMQRLFGPSKVCIAGTRRGKGQCELTPNAQRWMHRVNVATNYGQCEGMAALALSLFLKKDDVSYFAPSAKHTADLNREQVRAAIGYYLAYQFTEPSRSAWQRRIATNTPNKVLEAVTQGLRDRDDPVTICFFGPRQPNGARVGHVVTPYAVEDRGNGISWVRVYDSNHPGKSLPFVFDTNANTWRYSLAAINPSQDPALWKGDTSSKSITADKLSLRMTDAQCPFCPESDRLDVLVSGMRVSIESSSGGRIERKAGGIANTIAGAQVFEIRGYAPGFPPPEPVYSLPAGSEYHITSYEQLAGRWDRGVAVFGAGTALVLDRIDLAPKSNDRISISSDGLGISYRTSGNAAKPPKVELALETGADDYLLDLSSIKASADSTVSLRLDPESLRLIVQENSTKTSSYDFTVTRFADGGQKEQFTKMDLPRGLVASDELRFGNLGQ